MIHNRMAIKEEGLLGRAILYCSLILCFASPEQIIGQSKPMVNLDLGIVVDVIAPGDKAPMPLVLTGAEKSPVAKLSIDVGFSSKLLSFVEAARAEGLEGTKADVKTEMRDGEGEEKVLRVDIMSPEPISSGKLLTLVFEVSKGLEEDEQQIAVRSLRRSGQAADGQELEVLGVDGSITVLKPLPACFFYMH